MRLPALIFVLILALQSSCSEEREVKPLTYTKIFTGETEKTWAVEAVYVKKTGQADREISLAPCEQDDLYTFKADEERSFIIRNGGLFCDEGEGDIYVEYTWSFVNAGAVLNIPVPRIFGNFVVPFIVMEATKSRLVLEIFADAENTISYQVVFRVVKEE